MKKQNKSLSANVDDENQKKWENKKLGHDSKHAKAVYFETKKIVPTSMRLPQELIDGLKILAEESGIPYQTYIKMILTKHIRSEMAKKPA